MKKVLSIFAAIALLAFVSSCRTQESCPAYGKTNTVKAKSTRVA